MSPIAVILVYVRVCLCVCVCVFVSMSVRECVLVRVFTWVHEYVHVWAIIIGSIQFYQTIMSKDINKNSGLQKLISNSRGLIRMIIRFKSGILIDESKYIIM